jgi:hypothetical protein
MVESHGIGVMFRACNFFHEHWVLILYISWISETLDGQKSSILNTSYPTSSNGCAVPYFSQYSFLCEIHSSTRDLITLSLCRPPRPLVPIYGVVPVRYTSAPASAKGRNWSNPELQRPPRSVLIFAVIAADLRFFEQKRQQSEEEEAI